MKVLVVSDTHGRNENLRETIEIENPDMIYHLGDSQGLEDRIWMMTGAPVEMVAGNCDWGANLPSELVLELGKHKVFLTHGHYYSVATNYDKIVAAARLKGCDIVLHGHTHLPGIEVKAASDGTAVTIANPGSLSQPRQPSREHTYLIIDVDSEGELKFTLHSLEEQDRLNGN